MSRLQPKTTWSPRALLVVLLALLGGRQDVAFPDEAASALADAASAVERAVEAGNADDVATWAARAEPDPFLVAEVLCARSAPAALAFAAAGQGPDLAGLVAYVGRRAKNPPQDAEALPAAAAEYAAKDWAALGRREPGRDDTVAAVAVDLWRADAMRATGAVGKASRIFLDAAGRARAVGWLRAAQRGFFQAALSAHAAYEYEDMLRAFDALAGVEMQRERPGHAAEAIFFQGSVHTELGHYAAALRDFGRARDAFARLGNSDQVARVLNGIAYAYLSMGENSRALVLVEHALTLTESASRRMELFGTLGSIRSAIGEHEAAAGVHQRAVELARGLAPPRRVAQFLGDLGVAQTYAANYDAAHVAYSEALATFERLDDQPLVATALMNLGYLELQRGRPAEALPLCERALAVAQRGKQPRLLAGAEENVAQALQGLERHDEAIAAFERCIAAAEAIGDRSRLLGGQFGVAQCRLAKGDAAGALAAAEIAIAQLGTMVGGLAEGQEAHARAQHARLFEVAMEAAVQSGDAAAFARVLENGRAMALLESLEGRDEIRRISIPEAHREEEADAQAALAQARTIYRRAVAGRVLKESRRRRKELAAATKRLDEVVGRIRRAAKQAVALVYPAADDLAVLQARLEADEALVLYGLTEARYVALAIEKKSARIVPLAAREKVDAACAAFGGIRDGLDQDGKKELGALRTLVVAPLQLGSHVKRLLISPAGNLFLVPLSALIGEREIAYVPSGTTYGVLADGAPARGTSILALGDVDYGSYAKLGRLPATAKEAQTVGDTVILGKAATEEHLRKVLAQQPRWRAVHFACHGVLDMVQPMHSALALTSAAPDDGLLTVTEIFATRVPADLVVLSACESGRGKIYRAEGIVGLTRSFMYAGAPRVICSLWKVDDEATQALMLKFYKLWNPEKGTALGAAAALKAAQEHVRAQPKWKAPYYWGAWVLWGLPK